MSCSPCAICRSRSHHFWPDSISLLDRQLFRPGIPVGPQQITDIYLLGLAVKHGGRLATLDRRIPAEAVEHGPKALELLSV